MYYAQLFMTLCILHEEASWARKGKGDSRKDACEAGGKNVADCVDIDEKQGEV
jgi:hypothetical protein